MAILNLTRANQALKLFYLDGLREQLNYASPILSVIERDSENVFGDKIVMALRYGRNGGIGNRADDGDLPTANSRKTKQAQWDTKNIFARIQITDKTMRASRSNEGAFVSLLEADLEDAQNDAKDNLARQVFGDGKGKLATTAATAASATVQVDNAQYLFEGMIVDVVNPADGVVKHSGLEILEVDDQSATPSVKLSAPVTTDADDILVVSGNYGLELTGFGAVFTPDNTLYNINRAQNKWFNPIVKPIGGEISEIGIQELIDEAERRAGGKIDFLSSSYGVRRGYQNLLLATKQIVEVMDLKGGYKVLSYNGMPFSVDKYNPKGTLYGLDTSTWKQYQLMDFDWLEEDGAVLSRVANKAAWEAVLAKYADLGCSKPRGNFIATGIVEH
ncbi:phage major capsid protein [Brevibacillus migulae]|uniref:phage major capsid protein n=1 Tax=Brevibacillus migulae TaxID=1644114 RepID=UPI00106E8FF7|nr:phage major capsid protein [Brevibacillus migulae]